jgi:leader peptidase (prepilin peptidase)/N-methyltransferase
MTSVVTVLISATAAILVSPLLAAWTIGLTDRSASTVYWWQPRRVGAARLILVAAVAAILAVGAAGGVPPAAWWLFAAAGSVLCVVDVQYHLLPGRLVYPLAAIVLVALGVSAVLAGEPERLLRAILTAAAVGAVWFAVAFTTPAAMGLGDVRVATVAAGLLGWTSWSAVLAGQLAALGLAAITAGILAVASPRMGRSGQVPMGPALIAGAIAATWL